MIVTMLPNTLNTDRTEGLASTVPAEGAGKPAVSRDIVLLVDDVPQSLGALQSELESEGYTVLVAASGEAALQSLDLVAPDMVLMDALMPGLSGFDTCRRIKAHAAWAHIPVIFMTGLSDTSHIVEGFDAGGVDYVVKPVQAQEVRARLATHLRNARAVRMAREALDVGGNGVVVVDTRGRTAWQSPRARDWLVEFQPETPVGARVAWLDPAQNTCQMSAPDGRVLMARRLGDIGMGESMWLLHVQSAGEAAPSRLATASLTPRETEVLSWIAKGKTNRDVGDILGLSPRTVNKHLEHVFEKLGVETRAAAAALASRELGAG
jgi:DNA-binding NarL/FixJ family response regulator